MPKTPDYFHGKTLFVTGSASGIGRAAALALAADAWTIVAAGRRAEPLDETARTFAWANPERYERWIVAEEKRELAFESDEQLDSMAASPNGFMIDFHPATNSFHDFYLFGRNGAVAFGR